MCTQALYKHAAALVIMCVSIFVGPSTIKKTHSTKVAVDLMNRIRTRVSYINSTLNNTVINVAVTACSIDTK